MRVSRTIRIHILLLAILAGSCLAGTPLKHSKISSAILDLLTSGQLEARSGRQQLPDQSVSLTPAGLQVYIEMLEVSEAALADLRELGVTIELADPGRRLVQARVPPERIEAVAGLSSVRFIHLPDRGVSDR